MKKRIIFGFISLLLWPLWLFMTMLLVPSDPNTLIITIYLIFFFMPLFVSLGFFISANKLRLYPTTTNNEEKLNTRRVAKIYFVTGVILIIVSGLIFLTTVLVIRSTLFALGGGILIFLSFHNNK